MAIGSQQAGFTQPRLHCLLTTPEYRSREEDRGRESGLSARARMQQAHTTNNPKTDCRNKAFLSALLPPPTDGPSISPPDSFSPSVQPYLRKSVSLALPSSFLSLHSSSLGGDKKGLLPRLGFPVVFRPQGLAAPLSSSRSLSTFTFTLLLLLASWHLH